MNTKQKLEVVAAVVNRSTVQLGLLYKMLGQDINLLLELEQKMMDNFIHYCPGNIAECEKLLALPLKKTLYDYRQDYNLVYDFITLHNERYNENIYKLVLRRVSYWQDVCLERLDKLPLLTINTKFYWDNAEYDSDPTELKKEETPVVETEKKKWRKK